jgi:hypothetical protein
LYNDLADRWVWWDGFQIEREQDSTSIYDVEGYVIKDYYHRLSDEEIFRFIELAKLLR